MKRDGKSFIFAVCCLPFAVNVMLITARCSFGSRRHDGVSERGTIETTNLPQVVMHLKQLSMDYNQLMWINYQVQNAA